MWKFKPFAQKEPTGLEGRYIDVANLKIHVRNVFAEGGFSSVYLAQDATHTSKQYALKHIICNDEESLELVMKEISVMKSLRGHSNVVTLVAHAMLDMGRNKEALLVMEYCGKSLVSVLESRGSGYFEEKQVLSIFRDVCNSVFAMHCQSPPIAHRDLKPENLLLGSDGQWKLCDFGSTSTNHKKFEKPEEMGIEEDNIRKHTTPAYRSPEMWDLFRKERISEKVDIWALGCLLFRLCYFKNAFDGESKLQVLNGNYRIPELPKYSSAVIDLIKDMLQASPDDRPDITQVWFRVNEQLPPNLQKSLPDSPPELQSSGNLEGVSRSANKSPNMPRRSPPPPPSSGESTSREQIGAFWSSQHAKDVTQEEKTGMPKFDEEPASYSNASTREKTRPGNYTSPKNPIPVRDEERATRRHSYGSKDFDAKPFQKEINPVVGNRPNVSRDETFNTFVAEFDTNKLGSGSNNEKSAKDEALLAEIEGLKEQLKQTDAERAEMTFKFEKLSAICRSQRQELQELKQALASRPASSPNRDNSQNQTSSGSRSAPSARPREKIEGTIWELQQENPDPTTRNAEPWQAFAGDPKPSTEPVPKNRTAVQSVRTRNSQPNKQGAQSSQSPDSWGFETESFTAVPVSNSAISRPLGAENSSQRFKMKDNQAATQPAGWAGF